MANPAPLKLTILSDTSPRKATAVILVLSAGILATLLAVIYGHGRAASPPPWVAWLPAVNALLNGTSAVFLVLAYLAIRRGDVRAHVRRVLTALTASALFFVSYVAYHAVHGDSHFAGHGLVRPAYFFVLITHVLLSAVALPLIFLSVYLSLSGRFDRHRKVSRFTFPIWLYVSVTGVLVFVMLRAFA